MGYIEEIVHANPDLPSPPEIRAKMMIDLSLPLITGCYLPLYDNQVVWVYFRYEGIFVSAKSVIERDTTLQDV